MSAEVPIYFKYKTRQTILDSQTERGDVAVNQAHKRFQLPPIITPWSFDAQLALEVRGRAADMGVQDIHAPYNPDLNRESSGKE